MIKCITKAALSLLLITFAACIKEDLSDCGLYVAFKYDYNMAGRDKFPSDIDRIDLFVFDENGIFIGTYSDQGDHLDETYRMRLDLTPGIYSLIAWGCLGDDYDITAFVPGVTTFDQARLSLKADSGGNVPELPCHLYYGASMRMEVPAGKRHTELISLIKDTNSIRVIAKGLPYTPPSGDPFSCYISDVNGSYKFDNSLAGNAPLLYIPECNAQTQEFISDFVVMRLFPDGQPRIIVEYRPGGTGQPVEIFNAPLMPFIPPGTDLDRQDEYEIVLNFDSTFTCVSITVNGWTTALNGIIIG